MSRTVYAHQLPPEADPDVRALATGWIDGARAAQRPLRAMAYAIPGTILGVILWGEFFAHAGFDVHWYLTAGAAVVLGLLLGRPCRALGRLFDRRWAIVLALLGAAMAVLGDLFATIAIVRADHPEISVTLADVGAWLTGRQPIDWAVAVAAAVSAAFAARPPMDERQLVMQARVDVAAQRLDAAEAAERAAGDDEASAA